MANRPPGGLRPAECLCQELQDARFQLIRLSKRRRGPTIKEHQRALSTIDHLLEENRELRKMLRDRR